MVKRWYGQRRGQCLLTLSTAPTVSPAPDDSSHVWRRRPTGASTSHTRQQLPGSSCPSPARLLKHNCATLAPGRRARSREGHDEERTEAHDTGAIDCKKEELEVPMGTVRLVPSSSTFRAPIWTRARTPRCDLRSSTLATPSPIMRTKGPAPIVTCFLALPACHPPRRRRYLGTEGHESTDSYTPVFPSESVNQCETELRSRNENQ